MSNPSLSPNSSTHPWQKVSSRDLNRLLRCVGRAVSTGLLAEMCSGGRRQARTTRSVCRTHSAESTRECSTVPKGAGDLRSRRATRTGWLGHRQVNRRPWAIVCTWVRRRESSCASWRCWHSIPERLFATAMMNAQYAWSSTVTRFPGADYASWLFLGPKLLHQLEMSAGSNEHVEKRKIKAKATQKTFTPARA